MNTNCATMYALAMSLALGGCGQGFTAGSTGGTGGSTMMSTGPGGGAGGTGGVGGSGGNAPCGGSCKDPTPLCDKTSDKCVACLGDGDCKDAAKAKCDKGSCVPCTASEQCKAFAATPACDAGKCVECKLGEEMACAGGKTCDLVAKKCVAIAAGSVKNCNSCSNDVQCMNGACIALEFNKQPHGYFRLKAPSPGCQQPFGVAVNKASISGAAAKNYCGIDQDRATCEAVNAMLAGWVCSGMDGKCGPQNMPEVSVPGALCKQVGLLPNRCTYACANAQQCPSGSPVDTCGTGTNTPPGWCGG
jgi:hypothetical protein